MFINYISVFCQNSMIITFHIDVCKKKHKCFYSCDKPSPFTLNPIIINEYYNRYDGTYHAIGIVYKNNKPSSNIEIYTCKKLKHFGKTTVLWDSKYKIIRMIGLSNVPFYTLYGNNKYDSNSKPPPFNLNCNKIIDDNLIWCDTTGVFSINYGINEWIIFWDPLSKEGVLIYRHN